MEIFIEVSNILGIIGSLPILALIIKFAEDDIK